MRKLLCISITASTLALLVPTVASAHDRYAYRVCRDADGDRVSCHRQYRRSYEPTYRYRYSEPRYNHYRNRQSGYYGDYGGGHGFTLRFGSGGYYGGRW